MKKMFLLIFGVIVIGFFSSSEACAEEQFIVIKRVRGDVSIKQAETKKWTPAFVGMYLHEQDEIKTGDDSSVKINLNRYGEAGILQIKQNSLLRIRVAQQNYKTNETETLLDLAIGKVVVRTDKLEGESRFQVMTPTSTTDVQGALFEVEVE